ncbi:hypothetical protein GCM10009661_49670 [Catellatospora chokoriensis]|uniref:Uncharacterized protein n=1 Tax=Catellatospora chokoriensis TaxID=310353 RepID=A0A8J3NVA6_9ACTN|nr:hypothetical protein Cch02nite_72360 [Catellatospora chokoriensis]
MTPFWNPTGYATALSRIGYASVSARIQLQLAAHLSGWMAGLGMGCGALTDAVAAEYLIARRAAGHTYGRTFKALTPLLEYLRASRSGPSAAGWARQR